MAWVVYAMDWIGSEQPTFGPFDTREAGQEWVDAYMTRPEAYWVGVAR